MNQFTFFWLMFALLSWLIVQVNWIIKTGEGQTVAQAVTSGVVSLVAWPLILIIAFIGSLRR